MVCCPLKWCSYGPGWPHRLGVAFLAGGSIAALLADLHGIAPMHRVFSVASVPSMALLAVLAALPRVHPELRERIRVVPGGGELLRCRVRHPRTARLGGARVARSASTNPVGFQNCRYGP